MDNMEYDKIKRNRIEVITLAIFTLYVVGVSIMLYKEPVYWITLPMQVLLVVSWMSFITMIKTYQFRANMYALFLEINLLMYGFTVDNFQHILVSFAALIIILGLYESTKLLVLPIVSYIILLPYHLFIRKSIVFGDLSNDIQNILQLLAVPLTIYVVYFLVTEEQKNKINLLETIDELKETQKSKDDFLANVSHELRTPINTIYGMSEIVLRKDAPEDIQESLQDIRSAGKNLLSVVTDILDFSELQSGKMSLVNEPFNVTSTVNDVINMTFAKLENKDVELLVNCDISIPCSIRGDEQKLKRIILSLMDNAVKFTNEGYVSLDIQYRREDYGINMIVSVSDTGCGIKKEQLSNIFSGFTQGNGERNRNENGVGLGLSIAQALATLMGGVVSINSKENEGTKIQVVIPFEIADDTPIGQIENKDKLRFAAYFGLDGLKITALKDAYKELIVDVAKQMGVKSFLCKNIEELKAKVKSEPLTHIFTGYSEYLENKEFFDALTKSTCVVVYIDAGKEVSERKDNLIFVYKPIFAISAINVVNGNIGNQMVISGEHKAERFIMPTAHILVVDDSFMNVRVLEGLLKPYEIKITTASSGKEALNKVTTKDYDFIFMDHMMPEMDGIECMHRIRRMEDAYYKNVPIIALTANAVAGMREMFIEEGCADFLAKPVEISGLERILKKFISQEKIEYVQDNAIDSEGIGKPGASMVIGDLDIKKGILYCGSEENYLDILKMHEHDGDTNLNNIVDFYKREDWNNYTIVVHALKSSMKSIGAMRLSDMAKDLEQAGKDGRIDDILAGHDAMIKEYRRVIDMLRASEYIGNSANKVIDVETLVAVSDEELDKIIAEFEDAAYTFEADNMHGVLDRLKGCMYNGNPLDEDVANIRRKVEMSDYMSAIDSINRMKDIYRNR
ncbi:MAG: response regulator [Lachnospiraceae bacterium]|nr:response regulator [Candidatus Colinaster equi]